MAEAENESKMTPERLKQIEAGDKPTKAEEKELLEGNEGPIVEELARIPEIMERVGELFMEAGLTHTGLYWNEKAATARTWVGWYDPKVAKMAQIERLKAQLAKLQAEEEASVG